MVKGYIKIDRSIANDATMKNGSCLVIYLYIATRANWGETADGMKAGDAVLSLSKMCSDLGMSKNTALKYLRELERAGIIERDDVDRTKVRIKKYLVYNEKKAPDRGRKLYVNPFK